MGFGLSETEIDGERIRPHAANIMSRLQDCQRGRRRLAAMTDCPIGAYQLGSRIFATQYHPEITPVFAAALVEEYADKLPADVAARARESLAQEAETARFAARVVRFFEGAQDSAASKSIAVTGSNCTWRCIMASAAAESRSRISCDNARWSFAEAAMAPALR